MNLNSYVALLGRSFREVARNDGIHLEVCDDALATLQVPAADYIATLDADSLVTCDFALRLVAAMERPGNERVAIAQTPYTAVPQSAGRARAGGVGLDRRAVLQPSGHGPLRCEFLGRRQRADAPRGARGDRHGARGTRPPDPGLHRRPDLD
jgi:hypothetical protein